MKISTKMYEVLRAIDNWDKDYCPCNTLPSRTFEALKVEI